MKRSFLLSIIISCAVSAFGGPVTIDEAASKASAFLKARGMGNQNTISLAYQCRPTATGLAAPAKNAYYYVFNNEDKGFVIVSGDDCADDVLGYSDTGSFELENIPENLRGLLDCYAAEIEWARSNKLSSPSQDAAPAYAPASSQAVAPLLTTYWTQFDPFNLYCKNSSGVLQAAGCTAVAMAQVMYYHKWPKKATTAIPAYYISNWGSRAALSATTFNWSKMTDNYSRTDASDTEARQEVAKLVQYCGHSIRTEYKVSSSSAYMELVSPALCNYFGYENEARIRERQYYTAEEWKEMLLNDLQNGRPVIYSGTKNGNNGHAFVIDGFDGGEMFHINTGWGLTGCGYYKLSALNVYWASSKYTTYPGAYSIGQKAIFGVSPTQIDGSKGGITLLDLYMYSKDSSATILSEASFTVSAKYGLNGVRIRCKYTKTGSKDQYQIGLGLFKDGKLVEAKAMTDYNLSNEYMVTKNHDLSGLGVGLADGKYILRSVDREDENHDWKPCEQSDMMYVAVTVANGKATFKSYPVEGSASLKVTNVVQLHDVSENSTLLGQNYRHVRATMKNSGTAQCNELVYLYLDGYKKTTEGIYIGAGKTEPVDFYFFAATGSHTLVLKTASGDVIYNSSFSVTSNSDMPVLDLVSSEVKNLIDGTVYGTDVEAELVLKNSSKTAYNYALDVDVAIQEGSSYPVFHMKQPIVVPAGKFITIPLKFTLAEGDKFRIIVSDQNVTYMKTDYMVVSPAVVMWDGSGKRTAVALSSTVTVPASAAAVSLLGIQDLSKVTIKPNNNPNTLYYLAKDAQVPTVLSKKNVVKGTEASSITMMGGYDFYVPKAFTAAKIAYSFTPTTACDGKKGWQTIMLPFSVAGVTSDGKAVKWCRTSDTDQQFLLKEFTGDTASEVTFGYVDSWIPCKPYILGTPTALVNKKMVLSATNTWVATTENPVTNGTNFRFVASTEEKAVADVLALNAAGTAFVKSASATVKAGGAYFVPLTTKAKDTKSLSIAAIVAPKGDANGDNEVTVADALSVVGAILSGVADDEQLDVNGDGRVNVTDVMCVINILVTKE